MPGEGQPECSTEPSGPAAVGPPSAGTPAERAMLDGAIVPWIDRLAAATGVAEKRFARAKLERALSLADPGTLSEEDATRARELGASAEVLAAARRARSPHAVRVPLLAEDGSVFVRSFEVAFEPVEGRAVLGAEADEAARKAIALAAARLTARPDPRGYRFVPCSPSALAAARIEGRSLAAAAFVSALSLFSDRAVKDRTVITGAIEGDRVASVGSVRAKVLAAEAIGARVIVVPRVDREGSERAIGVATLDELEETCLELRPSATDPDALVALAARAARDGWSGYRWRSVREATTRALAIVPEGRPDLRVDALAQLAAASRHLGDLDASARAIELAVAVVESSLGQIGVPDDALSRLERQRAMHERARGRLTEATKAADRAVQIARRARLRGELLKSLGTRGLTLMAKEDDERALAVLDEALTITLERTPNDAARSRAYLAEALGRLGRMDEARAHADLALAECAAQGERGRAKEAWVRTSLAAAFASGDNWLETREVLEHAAVHEAIARDPLPGLLARRWLGVAHHRIGDPSRGSSLLNASVFAYGESLDPTLRFAADVNVLHDVAERARRGDLDAEAAREAMGRIAAFAAASLLSRQLSTTEKRLKSPARAADALHALAMRAGRLV